MYVLRMIYRHLLSFAPFLPSFLSPNRLSPVGVTCRGPVISSPVFLLVFPGLSKTSHTYLPNTFKTFKLSDVLETFHLVFILYWCRLKIPLLR